MDRNSRPQRLHPQTDRISHQNSNQLQINSSETIYNSEEERLKTFRSSWPHNCFDCRLLARTGLYYIPSHNTLRCNFCDLRLNNWHSNDPTIEHVRYSPNCPLLRHQPTRNIPIDSLALDRSLPPTSPDECGSGYHPFGSQQNRCSSQPVAPAFPHYVQEAARLTTFKEWPMIMKHKVQELVEAGFFYVGRGDTVQCFSCGGFLKDWEDSDNPWVEHAIWHSNCKFLNLMRGREFIDECVAKHAERQREIKEQRASMASMYDRQISVASSTGGGDIDENNVCRICCIEERNTVFLPCGHVVACAKCAASVNKCPVCRLPFSDVIRLYFS